MKKMLMLLVLVVCLFVPVVHAEIDGIAYTTTVCNGVFGTYNTVDISTSTKVRIHKLTITCTNDESSVQQVTIYGDFSGAGVNSTTTAKIIYKADFSTSALNTPRIIQENYPDFLPLTSNKGLIIRKSNDNSVVKVSLLIR